MKNKTKQIVVFQMVSKTINNNQRTESEMKGKPEMNVTNESNLSKLCFDCFSLAISMQQFECSFRKRNFKDHCMHASINTNQHTTHKWLKWSRTQHLQTFNIRIKSEMLKLSSLVNSFDSLCGCQYSFSCACGHFQI